MLDVDRIRRVNVTGTVDLIDACVKKDVSRLIYTSTYNVVFVGRDIVSVRWSPFPFVFNSLRPTSTSLTVGARSFNEKQSRVFLKTALDHEGCR